MFCKLRDKNLFFRLSLKLHGHGDFDRCRLSEFVVPRCPFRETLQGGDDGAAYSWVKAVSDFEVGGIAVGVNDEGDGDDAAFPLLAGLGGIDDAFVEPLHEGFQSSREFRHLFHCLRGHDFLFRHGKFLIVDAGGVNDGSDNDLFVGVKRHGTVKSDDSFFRCVLHDDRCGVCGAGCDDAGGEHAGSGLELHLVAVLQVLIFQLRQFLACVLQSQCDLVAFIDGIGGVGDGEHERQCQHDSQCAGIAFPRALSDAIGTIVSVASFKDEVAPFFGCQMRLRHGRG